MVAADSLVALFRGGDDVEARVGAVLLAETILIHRKVWTKKEGS